MGDLGSLAGQDLTMMVDGVDKVNQEGCCCLQKGVIKTRTRGVSTREPTATRLQHAAHNIGLCNTGSP